MPNSNAIARNPRHDWCRVRRFISCKEAELSRFPPRDALCRPLWVSNGGHAKSIPPRQLTFAVHKKVASLRQNLELS